jgi:TatD DNase family protein
LPPVDRRPSTGDFPRIFATIGIHPHEAKLAGEEDFAQLASLARHPRVLAWGEIGLDYYYDHSPRDIQKSVFLRQLEMAQAARLPIVIHCRPSTNSQNAWDELISLLRRHWAQSGLGGVLHCFTGELEHAHAALEMGFLISFAGNVTFPKAENIRRAAQTLPLDRILIETDSPFLTPVPHRGKRNEPAFVVEVARQIAELRGAVRERIGLATTENFHRFFRLGNPSLK